MRGVAVIPGKEGSAHLRDLPRPAPAADEALVRVVEAGVDGTDREIEAGRYGEAPEGDDFLILGHEALGRVESVGAAVQEVVPGEWVVATVRRPDGCPNCRLGESDMCLWGRYKERGIKRLHGYFSDYYVERPGFLVQVPEALRPVAIFLDPLSVAEKGVRQAFRIQQRMYWGPRRALILGAGPIGFLSLILCRLRDLETSIFSRSPRGSETARRAEAVGAIFLSGQEQSLSALRRKTEPFDLIVECTGSLPVALEATCLLDNNGVMAMLGIYDGAGGTAPDCLGRRLVLGNQLIFGSVNSHRNDFLAGINDLARIESRWPGWLGRLITRRLPFERFREGLVKEQEEVKTVLEVGR